MAYRAEIEIGVKGAKKLEEFRSTLENSNKVLRDINDQNDVFGKPLQSLKIYQNNLQLAVENLNNVKAGINNVKAGIKGEQDAIKEYLRAAGELNSFKQRQNQLIQEEAQKLGLATQALKAYNAEAAAPTQRGAATTMAGSYLRGQPSFGPQPAADFDPVAAQARARASQLSQESIARGKQAKKDRDLINAVTSEVTEFQRRKFIDINNTKIGFLQTQLDFELDNIDRVLSARNKANRKDLADFDRRLSAKVEASKKAEDAIAKQRQENEKRIATIRKEALRSIQKLENEAIKKRQARSKQRKEAIGSGIIGGAFPLLFGQGPAAALGGGVGGTLGGAIGGQFGFGLSLVGTQLGVIVDQTIANVSELGQALNPLTVDLGKIAEAAGYAGTETEKYISAIEKNAGKQAALAAATEQLSLLVGAEGVQALKDFGAATQDLGSAFSQLMTQMGAGFAELLSGATQGVADSISEGAALSAGLRQTTGVIGTRADEFKGLLARTGKVTSGQQLKDNERLRTLRKEIVALVEQERRKLVENLKATEKQFKVLEKIKLQQTQAQTQLNLLDITEQAAQKSNEAADIRKKATDLVADKEKQIESLRLGLESEVASIRLSNIQKANAIQNAQEQLRILQLKNSLKETSTIFARTINLNEQGRNFAINLRKAADTFAVARATADAKRNKTNRDAEVELESLKVKAEQTRARIAKQAEDIKLRTAAKAADIQTKASEYDARLNADRFEVEKKITQLRINQIEAETKLLRLRFESLNQLTDEAKTYFKEIESLLKTTREAVDSDTVPSAIGNLNIDTNVGVSMESFNAVIDESKTLLNEFKASQEGFITEDLRSAALDFAALISTQTQALVEQKTPLEERNESLTAAAEQARLVAEGFSEVDATAIVRGTQAFRDQLDTLTNARLVLEGYRIEYQSLEEQTPEVTEVISALSTEIDKVTKRINQTTNQASNFVNSFEKTNLITEYIKELNDELTNTEAMAIRVADSIANAIGSSLNTAISGLIEGSTTVKEVFSDLLKSVGQVLVQEGTKMIATYIAIGIAKAFAGLSGASKGFDASLKTPVTGSFGTMTPPSFTGLASGGPTDRNRTYLVGEQGPELFTPNQAGRVSSASETRSLLGRSNQGNAPAMNFTFETTNIGGKEFVDREQLEAAMAITRSQAANDGAKKGMGMTLDKMQHSPATRRRVGIS